MAAPTKIQQAVLRTMRGYHVMLQFTTGELAVARGREYQSAKVIDTGGCIHSYTRYLAARKRRPAVSRRS